MSALSGSVTKIVGEISDCVCVMYDVRVAETKC